jgi:hypothetical protein
MRISPFVNKLNPVLSGAGKSRNAAEFISKLSKREAVGARLGHDNDITVREELVSNAPKELPQPSFDSVSGDCLTHLRAYRYAQPAFAHFIHPTDNHKVRGVLFLPLTRKVQELRASGKAGCFGESFSALRQRSPV